MKPTVGRIVHFQTDERGGKRYVLPAVITCTFDSHPDAERSLFADGNVHMDADYLVEGNPVPVPDTNGGGFVHLHVMSPGPTGAYTELTVPFDDSAEPAPRSWHWPPREEAPKPKITVNQVFQSQPEPEVRFVPVPGGRGGGMLA